MKQNGTLFIVATPIGNLADITLRAIETLKSVDAIACEDTRVSRKLLNNFDIKKELISLHQHSEDRKLGEIINRLERGQNIAYITDGGTPAVSDPGSKLIQRIREIPNSKLQIPNKFQNPNYKSEKLEARSPKGAPVEGGCQLIVVPIPGPSALAAAVSVSGLVEKEFYFAGFLPKKKGRETKFLELTTINAPVVIFESALRLEKTLKDIENYFGADAEVFIAREMTKMFEEYWGGAVREVIAGLGEHKLKGEVTLIVKHSLE